MSQRIPRATFILVELVCKRERLRTHFNMAVGCPIEHMDIVFLFQAVDLCTFHRASVWLMKDQHQVTGKIAKDHAMPAIFGTASTAISCGALRTFAENGPPDACTEFQSTRRIDCSGLIHGPPD